MKRLALPFLLLLAVSCSTTKLMPAGSYRLVSNKVEFEGKQRVPSSDVTQYIRQQSNKTLILGWSPGLSIYNWSNGSGEGINKVWEAIGTAPVVFDPALTQSSCENIASHLETLGYYDSKVRAEISYQGRLARVKYFVEPGKRFRIDHIVYEVPDGDFGEAFRADSANMTIHEGDFLSEKALEAETVRGTSVFRNQGYYDFNKNHYFFEADTLTDETTLYYRIRGYMRGEPASADAPISRYRIGDVRISHPADIPFRESLLRKFNPIQPGQWYEEQVVNEAFNRYSSIPVFNNVSVEMTPSDSAVVDSHILLEGSDLVGVKANLEASSNSSGLLGFSPQISLYHKNLFHGGEWLDIGFTGNWQWIPKTTVSSAEFGVSASLSFPRLLGYPISKMRASNIPRTEISASYNYQNRPEYRRTLGSFSYGYSGQIGERLFYQYTPVRIGLVHLFAVDTDFLSLLVNYPYLWDTFEDQIDAGMNLMLYHTTDASIVPKGAYHYERINLSTSGNLLSLFNPILPDSGSGDVGGAFNPYLIFNLPYKQYFRVEMDLGRVFRFGWNDNQALALHAVAGIGKPYGNSLSMPFERQFYVGGASSMRGWQARTLGPGSMDLSGYYRLPSATGDFKLEFDMEYRFPMFWKLEAAMFAETGNVWRLFNGSGDEREKFRFPTSLAADWGLGLRVNLDFILLRLDAGFRLYDPVREEGDRWVRPRDWLHGSAAIHFGVGYPF